jgi:ATP synthase subunit 6
MKLFLIQNPLEQFEILPLIYVNFGFLDFSITNQTLMLFFVLFFFFSLFFILLKSSDNNLYIIPLRWQSIIEFFYSLILSMVIQNINGKNSNYFFPLVFSIFSFILCLNLFGLIPYSFTVTSHCISTLALSLTIFLGMNIICVNIHKFKFFSLFLPSGTSILLAFLLVPVELISYIFKPLSLAIRLFCNMMAGHTLLKVFAGFSWSLMSFSGIIFFLHLIPLIILIPLFLLEFGVALIQAYVFSLLTCIYLNDVLNLH